MSSLCEKKEKAKKEYTCSSKCGYFSMHKTLGHDAGITDLYVARYSSLPLLLWYSVFRSPSESRYIFASSDWELTPSLFVGNPSLLKSLKVVFERVLFPSWSNTTCQTRRLIISSHLALPIMSMYYVFYWSPLQLTLAFQFWKTMAQIACEWSTSIGGESFTLPRSKLLCSAQAQLAIHHGGEAFPICSICLGKRAVRSYLSKVWDASSTFFFGNFSFSL